MSVSPTLALRLDPETIERLDEQAELRGQTRSSLARHLLRRSLDGDQHERRSVGIDREPEQAA